MRPLRILLLLGLLFASPAFAKDPTFVAKPERPTGLDVSYRVLDEGYPFKWCASRTPAGGEFVGYKACTQTGMDAMTETSLVMLVNLVRSVRTIRGSQSTIDFMLSDSQGASAITALLNPVYEGNFGKYHGTWQEDWSGKDYSKPKYAAGKARKLLLGNATSCAKAPEIAKFLDFVNLQIVSGKCVDKPFEPLYPETKIDKSAKSAGIINYTTKQPLPTGSQLVLLHETHYEHERVSDWRCGEGSQPAPGVVTSAHLRLEASARTEAEMHFFTLKAFSGDVDPQWTPTEVCKWARLQDYDHERWMLAVMAGNWANSRKAENDHSADHLCMNLRDPRLKIRRTDCGAASVNDCPVETCFDVLAKFD